MYSQLQSTKSIIINQSAFSSQKIYRMKQNYNLFIIRTIFPLTTVISIAFLLQGCFCKDCGASVSQQKSDLPSIVYKENGQKKSETVPMAVVKPDDATQTIVYPLQTINDKTLIRPVESFITTSDISNAVVLPSKAPVENDRDAYTVVPVNQDRWYMLDDKINPAMLAVGKSCPLGIRSISSRIIAGPNMSFKSSKEGDDVYGGNAHKHQPGAGFQLGVGYGLAFSDKFSVNPSLLLKQNNASEKMSYRSTEPGGNYGSDTKDKYSFTYLSAPVTANYKVGKQVEVFAGPEINYLLRASVKTEDGTGGDDKENITKNSVKLGVGVQAGVKYRIPSGSGDSPFSVQLLYEQRISRLNKKHPDGYNNYTVPAWNMGGVQLGVTCEICELMKGRN